MSDMKITIRFRWKTCMHSVINAFFKIFVYNILNKVFGNCLVVHDSPS